MKRAGSGRVARKIGAYDGDSAESTDTSSGTKQEQGQTDTVVKRPTFAKAKKRSSQRISFGSSAEDGDESSDTAVITPKKSTLSRIAIEKNAERRARSPLVPSAPLKEDRPSYDKSHLDELRNSTPSTPKDLKPTSDEEDEVRELDIASKFGSPAPLQAHSSAIPTDAEIKEKKARRARLASEYAAKDDNEEGTWDSDDNDEFRGGRNEISLRPKEEQADTRLVHEDEDMAEGFDDYVEDGGISLGRKAERAARQRRRAEMAELIDNAEGGSDDDGTDDSEAERHAAYEEAQTRAGAYGKTIQKSDDGARTPPKITPLPDLEGVLERLQLEVTNKEQRRAAMMQRLQELRDEKTSISERQKYLQEQLQKTGEQYEKLRLEAGMPALPASGGDGTKLLVNRGLESLGTTPLENTPIPTRPEDD